MLGIIDSVHKFQHIDEICSGRMMVHFHVCERPRAPRHVGYDNNQENPRVGTHNHKDAEDANTCRGEFKYEHAEHGRRPGACTPSIFLWQLQEFALLLRLFGVQFVLRQFYDERAKQYGGEGAPLIVALKS